jgi:hypothetical protein
MAFPHRTAPSTHLSTVVDLPQRTAGDGHGGRRSSGDERRRRRAVGAAAREDA